VEKSVYETDILTAVHGKLLLKQNIHFAQGVERGKGRAFNLEIVNALENVAPPFSCLRTCCGSFMWCASLLVTLLQYTTYIKRGFITEGHNKFFWGTKSLAGVVGPLKFITP
jgi:hypothetical protein